MIRTLKQLSLIVLVLLGGLPDRPQAQEFDAEAALDTHLWALASARGAQGALAYLRACRRCAFRDQAQTMIAISQDARLQALAEQGNQTAAVPPQTNIPLPPADPGFAAACRTAAAPPQHGGPHLQAIDISAAATACSAAIAANAQDWDSVAFSARVAEAAGAYQDAAQSYQLAAQQDHKGAQAALAWLYRNDPSLLPNLSLEQAKSYAQTTALAGEALGQRSWGLWLLDQAEETKGNQSETRARAAQAFRGAADKGDGLSMLMMGYLHEEGLGLPLSIDAARDWYAKAAQAGEAAAFARLALIAEQLGDSQAAAEALLQGLEAGDLDTYVLLTDGMPQRPQSVVWALQTSLKRKGYYSGGIDGLYGPGTQRAIRDFSLQALDRQALE